MTDTRSLAIGLVQRGTVYDEVTMEMLDHQGVCYDRVEKNAPPGKKYPAVLVSTDSDDVFETASANCTIESNVIFVNQLVDFGLVLRNLSGQDQRLEDRFDMVVNEQETKLVKRIKDAMSNAGLPYVFKSFWPNNAKMCCVMTHDIDWFSYSPFHKVVLQGPMNTHSLLRLLYGYATGRDLGWNVPSILEINRRFGVKSTFFLQTQYGSDDTTLGKTSQLLRHEGYDIGLHAAHFAHSDADALRSEVELFTTKIGLRPTGIRHHILKFKAPETWKVELEGGFEYDCTFSRNEYFGFRGGVCYPYHPIDGQRLPILELPTSFMDWTALKRRERGDAVRGQLQSIMKRVEEYHGVFVSNFHNTYLNGESFPDIMDGYSWLLTEASRQGYWVATAQQCVDWWKRRTSERPSPQLAPDKSVSTNSSIPLVIERSGEPVAAEREN